MTLGHVLLAVCVELTISDASGVQASDISRSPANASRPATVVWAAGASLTIQPSTVVAFIVPVTSGAVLSSIVIVCMISTLVLRHASVTLYVLVIIIGQVPVAVWVTVTTKAASAVQASWISRSPARPSRPATVVCGVGASFTVHASIVVGEMVPVMTGGVLSSTLIVCMMVTLVLLHASVTRYVRVITIGHVPLVV